MNVRIVRIGGHAVNHPAGIRPLFSSSTIDTNVLSKFRYGSVLKSLVISRTIVGDVALKMFELAFRLAIADGVLERK